MPWLSELVETSEGSLDVLPVQCLCEFLLMRNSGTSRKDDSKDKHSQVPASALRLLSAQSHPLGIGSRCCFPRSCISNFLCSAPGGLM